MCKEKSTQGSALAAQARFCFGPFCPLPPPVYNWGLCQISGLGMSHVHITTDQAPPQTHWTGDCGAGPALYLILRLARI